MNAEAAATRHFAVEPQKGEIVAVVHLAADLVTIDVLIGKIRPQFLHDGEAGVDVGVAGCEGDGEFLSIHGGHFPPFEYPTAFRVVWNTVCQMPQFPQASSHPAS